MDYAELTFKDRNAIKRWVQRRRLVSATAIAPNLDRKTVLDFGGGNGELCKFIRESWPSADVTCYEPYLTDEAARNLSGSGVAIVSDVARLSPHSIDVLFCLEVFEHLSELATRDALASIRRILKKQGTAIFGVPIEIGLPALGKGLFRMTRAFGQFDAKPAHVALATFGRPPPGRPFRTDMAEYTSFHLGFDHRRFQKDLSEMFKVTKTVCSPFHALGPWANSEIYFVANSR